MNNLSSLQRSFLRSRAHDLQPVVLIGKHGLTAAAIKMVNIVFDTRELIKIKFRAFKDEKILLSNQLAKSTESDVVGIIGHTVILFRQNPDLDKQRIHLPGIK